MFYAKKVKDQIIKWIAEYFKNNGSPATKAVIGISGGKDSSIVAALCVEALGRNRVLGVLMPQGEQQDIDVSFAEIADICAHLTPYGVAARYPDEFSPNESMIKLAINKAQEVYNFFFVLINIGNESEA
jgi:tRNA(Ile)-lysidine synthase TilS/MesJ